jgi:hypothetical protein
VVACSEPYPARSGSERWGVASMYFKLCFAALAASLLLQSAWALAPNLIQASNSIHAAEPQSVFSHHNHEITSLPGFSGELPTRQFGGYITVDKKHGRHLYYYMVEAEGNPEEKPVVLWLNGGPGCSSFDGFMFEHGPFFFNFTDNSYNKLQLNLNPYSWHKAATMIYLDSPSREPHSAAGVLGLQLTLQQQQQQPSGCMQQPGRAHLVLDASSWLLMLLFHLPPTMFCNQVTLCLL